VRQVTSPVRFADCVRAAAALGVRRIVEPAPGRVLTGLVRRIAPDLVGVNADTADALEALQPQAESA
jgi:[acyl-carrier-protein] S-malonyltransferase